MSKFEQLRNVGLGVGLLGVVAVGCGDIQPEIEKGQPATVIDTEFIPEHTILVNGMCAMRSEGFCIMYYKKQKVVPDRYLVTLEQCQEAETIDDDSTCERGTITVNLESFELASTNPVVFYTESGTLEYFAE